jgi:CheY-like chemotaxis protein
VQRESYDAVLMDCQMPVMDGFEATRQIRRNAYYADLPILAMTANAMVGDKEKCLEAGMNAHIPKPIDVNQLFKVLAQWIKPRSLRRALAAAVPKPAVAIELPALPGVDMEAVLKRLMGNSMQYKRLLTMFYQGQADVVVRLRQAWDSGNKKDALREAHTLKGLAASVGADALAAAASDLEIALCDGHDAKFEGLLAEVEAPLDNLIEALEQFLSVQ